MESSFLECWKCKESLRVGQNNWLYMGDTRVRENLNLFLQRHVGHSLVFSKRLDPQSLPGKGWIGFEGLDYEEKLKVNHDFSSQSET